jgi:pSer/pThr/pTyr-binding forkhead associated (FHA) protein
MLVRLIVEKGGKRKNVFELRGPNAVLGRAQGSSVRIPSEDVSRRHCRLHFHDGYITVEDLASINGTFLNGMRVQGEAVVRPGDRVEVGPASFLVEYVTTPEILARLTKEDYEVIAEEEAVDAVLVDEEEMLEVELVDEEEPMEIIPVEDEEEFVLELDPEPEAKPGDSQEFTI